MEKEKRFTEAEAHRHFAVSCFNKIWPLLEKEDRTEAEDQLMIHLAHTSQYHWLQVGEPINEQRGEWMLARVYTILEQKEQALTHAKQCFKLTEEQDLKDFDLGYSYEAMARASALNIDKVEYLKYHDLATQAGQNISKAEDRKLFEQDLENGPWFGFSK